MAALQTGGDGAGRSPASTGGLSPSPPPQQRLAQLQGAPLLFLSFASSAYISFLLNWQAHVAELGVPYLVAGERQQGSYWERALPWYSKRHHVTSAGRPGHECLPSQLATCYLGCTAACGRSSLLTAHCPPRLSAAAACRRMQPSTPRQLQSASGKESLTKSSTWAIPTSEQCRSGMGLVSHTGMFCMGVCSELDYSNK